MAIQNEVKGEVLRAFESGDHLGMRELMERTGRDRIVYKYVAELVREGVLVVVCQEPTARKPRMIYGLASLSEPAPF